MKEILERIGKARFLTTDEIFEKRKEIRKEVQKFDADTLEVYQWYFFRQLCLLKNPLRDMLWDYLVLDSVSVHQECDLCVEYKNYKERCKQILQYQKKNNKENEEIDIVEKKKTIRITCVEDLFKI